MGSSEKDVWGWIASNEADLAANYANRGRSYRDLSNDELTARSIASFREIAADLRNYKARAVTADLKSEFDLRTIAPPYDLVKGELNKLASALASTIEEIRAEHPGRYEELESDIQRDIDEFKEKKNERS